MKFETKSDVRSYVRGQGSRALPVAGVLKNLSQFLNLQKGSWGAFKALAEEPAIEGCLTSQIQWFYPRLRGELLEFVKPEAWGQSQLRFFEPTQGPVAEADSLDGFLVPGLAFSKKGQRVGRGKGFYDRTLQSVRGLKVGVCYSYQLFEELPCEDHDVKMDVVVSDQGILWMKRS
jgi:5-formyltetrahydrofolate cyclo-ligase